jgi:hypothetical protein
MSKPKPEAVEALARELYVNEFRGASFVNLPQTQEFARASRSAAEAFYAEASPDAAREALARELYVNELRLGMPREELLPGLAKEARAAAAAFYAESSEPT